MGECEGEEETTAVEGRLPLMDIVPVSIIGLEDDVLESSEDEVSTDEDVTFGTRSDKDIMIFLIYFLTV